MMKRIKCAIACVVITVSILVMLGAGHAGPEITLVVNPKATEISAGSEQIVITADASGKNLTFTWKLSGPGKLEDKGAAAFYIPPKKIDEESASAIVTVTVKEPSGQATIKSVTFSILPSPAKTATPSPEPTFVKKKGMSKVTMVALGAGAAAAFGGGIALATGGDGSTPDIGTPAPTSPTSTLTPTPTPKWCNGVEVGGYCWYLGAMGQSCNDVCTPYGGYHEATRTYAGSDGSASNCGNVLDTLGAPGMGLPISMRVLSSDPVYGLGCVVYLSNAGVMVRAWCSEPQTSAEGFGAPYQRACACNK